MFAIGDYVLNQHTQNLGRVIGYGHRSQAELTVKVLVAQSADTQRRGFIEEDHYSAWTPWQYSQQSQAS
jgi:hypothetical protein